MKRAALLIGASAILAACSPDPAAQDGQGKAGIVDEESEQDKVERRQNSIESAAEEATKIIEADAKAEIDSIEQGAQAK